MSLSDGLYFVNIQFFTSFFPRLRSTFQWLYKVTISTKLEETFFTYYLLIIKFYAKTTIYFIIQKYFAKSQIYFFVLIRI